MLSLFLLGYSQSTTVVISQVYGAGGNSGATYNADYVEVHNISVTSQSLAGLSIQYGSSAVTGAWSGVYALPSVSIPAGGYYLIQMSGAGAVGAALPTPDAVATPAISMAAASGRVALVTGTTPLNACPASSAYIDFVGYGASTCFEGSGATGTLSATLAAFRNANGCT
ncbi:MAG: lamin tail domain-containing protein, partial [Ferruginibacter sp.]